MINKCIDVVANIATTDSYRNGLVRYIVDEYYSCNGCSLALEDDWF